MITKIKTMILVIIIINTKAISIYYNVNLLFIKLLLPVVNLHLLRVDNFEACPVPLPLITSITLYLIARHFPNIKNPLKNFGIELFFQKVPLQVFSSIYNVSLLSSRWISVVPQSTLETPKPKYC